ncbi:hypothetical protein BGX29_011861 [Mortierella sp. GBA35]|nr:hypothetical protein BGX23_012447 [Mortierella sp. AD031]KAF9089805.1 hypothetical protein BGX29_011861 [Mortierella sp. GBA35]KAG0217224.1 hypothetical protein BGX33_011102 [Mortierella sp. NVP41]
MASSGLIDQDQLEAQLTRLIMDHNHSRTILFRYVRRAVALCPWNVDQDSSSFFRQFERVDKLTDMLQFIRHTALQNFENVEQTGNSLLSEVDALLARPMPPAAGSPLNGAMSPSNRGSNSHIGINGHSDPNGTNGGPNAGPNGGTIGVNGASAGIGAPFNNNRVLILAGEVKEAIRFWREQCLRIQSMDNLVCELDRIIDLRPVNLRISETPLEDKINAVKSSYQESRLVADRIEPLLDAWLHKLQEEHAHMGHGPGYGPHSGGIPHGGGTPGHLSHGLNMSLDYRPDYRPAEYRPDYRPDYRSDYRPYPHPVIGSPASYSSQPWGPGS